jgi:hypothetical protein
MVNIEVLGKIGQKRHESIHLMSSVDVDDMV